MTFEMSAKESREADTRIRYVTHRHQCNGWCRLSLHAGLTYSRRPDDISDRIRADYESMGYRVLEVRRATEVPTDDPRLIVRPYPWLVWFHESRRDAEIDRFAIPSSRSDVVTPSDDRRPLATEDPAFESTTRSG